MYRIFTEYRIYQDASRESTAAGCWMSDHVPGPEMPRCRGQPKSKSCISEASQCALAWTAAPLKGTTENNEIPKVSVVFMDGFSGRDVFVFDWNFVFWRNWSKIFSDFETNNSLSCDLLVDFQVYRRGKFEFRCSIFRSEWRFGAKRTRCSLSLVLDLFEMMCSS